MKLPNQTMPVERKVHNSYSRAVGGANPSFLLGLAASTLAPMAIDAVRSAV